MSTSGEQPGFREFVAEHNLAVMRVGTVLIALLMPFGSLLDWLTNPGHLAEFFYLRIGSSVVSFGLLALSYAPWAIRYTQALTLATPLPAAAAIAVMILELGGYASPYYAGLNLLILGIGVGYTWRVRETVTAAVLIVAMWLVPALFQLPNLEIGPFSNNLYFLFLTSVIAVFCTETRYRQARREFEAKSALARTSEQLASTLKRLRELDEAKNEFFANISHELRTPLTLILSPVEDRLERGGTEADPALLEVVRRNAVRLLRLIDDLLDLARIDAGRLRLRIGAVDLRLLVEQAVESFLPAATAKQIALSWSAPPSTPNLYGDPHRLEIIITNLLGNALKFTGNHGSISITVEQSDTHAEIAVTDTGDGIAPEDLEKIFARFHQVESSARRRREGAGIGLALARELAELHGGTIEVTSELGRGSTFRVRLPLGKDHFHPDVIDRRKVNVEVPVGRRATDYHQEREEAAPVPVAPLPERTPGDEVLLEGGRRPRILVAEDNADLREFLRTLLAPSYEVIVAVDGREALERVRSERPDLVLSDVMMPHLTGTDLCTAIKGDDALQNTPVILLTARTGSEAVLEGYTSGADDFVNKPIHPRILLARIRAQLRLRALSLQLAHQERLAAVGTLAAGVGHEVRNPINAVLNGARALLDRQGLEPSMRRVLEVIEEAGRRIDGISAALLDHAHPAEQDRPRPCDVKAGIEATLRLLEHRTKHIQVHRAYATDSPVLASAAELNQVFLNLLDNALRSSAKNVWVRVEEKDGKVCVGIDDDGPGVPREIASRIFDPFFTTRGPGEGTGLGLYLSRKIVNRYGGELHVGDRPGGGAAFSVELPREGCA